MLRPDTSQRIVRLFLSLCVLSSMVFSLGAHANIGVSKTRADGFTGTPYVGDIDGFRIRLSNNFESGNITGVSFTDTMPAGFRVAGAGVVSQVCEDGTGDPEAFVGTVSAALGSNTIELTGGSIPPRNGGGEAGYCEIVVEVTSTQSGTGTNTLPASSINGTHDGNAVTNADAAQQSLNFQALPAPTISKSFSSSTVVKADEATRLTITISNSASQPLPLNGAGDSPAFAIRDQLGTFGLAVAPDPDVQISCGANPPAFSPAAADTTITAVGGEVPANSSCELSVMVVADGVNNAYSTNVTNTIDRTNDFGNQRGLTPASDATASMSVTSALRVEKDFSPATVSAGQEAILTIRLTNASPLSALDLGAFSDDIDGADSNLLITSAPTVSCTGGSSLTGLTGQGTEILEYTSGTLQPDSNCLITVPYTATLDAAGTAQSFTNTIPEGGVAVTSPADVVSQPAVASVTVADRFRVEKSSSPAEVAPGNPVRFDVRVRNFSTQPQTVTVTDNLPTGMELLDSTESYPDPVLSGTGCSNLAVGGTQASPEFTFDIPSGTAGSPAACSVRFWAMAPESAEAGAIVNTIGGGDVCNGGGICSDTSASASFSNSGATLSVEKTFDESSKPEGSPATMTLTLVNLSADPVTNITLTDNLPLGSNGTPMLVASPNNASSTCGGVISALPDSDQVVLTGAEVPGRADLGVGDAGRCTLTVNVTGAAGSYVNELPAGAATGDETLPDGTSRQVQSPGPVSRNINFLSALSGSKSFFPNVIQSGGSSTVTIRLTNSQPGVLEDVSVVDNLPAGMQVSSPANAYTTCAGATVISAVEGSGSVSLSGAEIPQGSCDLLFDVTATGGSDWVNTIAPGELTASGGVENVNPISATLQNGSGGAVIVSLNHATPSLSAPGAATQLVITLLNNGSLDLSNLNLESYFTDTGLASGALTGELIASTANASTTCTDGAVSAVPGETSLALVGASLAAGDTCTVTVDVTMNRAGTVTAIIPATSVTSAQGISNADAASSSLQTSTGLGVVKEFTPKVVSPGESSRLRVTLFNPTSQPVENLSLVDAFPAGLEVASPSNEVTTCGGSLANTTDQFSITGGTIPAGSSAEPASCYLEIDVVAPAQGDYVNEIPTGAVTGEVGGAPVSNNEPAQDTLRAKSALSVHKAIEGLTLDAGDPAGFSTGTAQGSAGNPYRLTISITNPNNAALSGLAFTDTLPEGLVVATTPNATNGCGGSVSVTPSGTDVRLAGGSLVASETCLVAVDVLSNVPGTYTNTITTGTVTTNEGVTNDDQTRAQIVISSAPTVAKQFEPAVIPQNGVSRLTIYVNNPNDVDMTLTSTLTDNLPVSPGPVTVDATPDVGGTCPVANVTATAGAGQVSLASGTVVPAGGCTVEVNVTASAAGEHTNTIEAGALQTDLGDNPQAAFGTLNVSTLGYVSGRVYLDNDLTNGDVFASGQDTPLAGVTIELRDGNSCAGPLVAGIPTLQNPGQTSASGSFLFSGLPAGTYSVCQPEQPTGSLNGDPVTGSIVTLNGSTGTAGVASNPETASVKSQIVNIVLNENGAGEVSGSVGNLFPEVAPSDLGGTVFIDENNDGVRQGSESGIAGVEIVLSGTDWQGRSVDRTTTTDNSGNYQFEDLPPGTYSVTEPDQPTGTANGKTNAGATGGTVSGVDETPSRISNIDLPPATVLEGLDFGELATGRSIFGRVFLDRNASDIYDEDDSGLEGQRIELSGVDINGNNVDVVSLTNADGTFAFTELPAGVYTLTQPNQPGGTSNGVTIAGSAGGDATLPEVIPSAIANIDLTAQNISVGNDFGELVNPASPGRSISGRVFHDLDRNALYDGDDVGLGGQTIVLWGVDNDNNPVNATTVTASDGTYIFTGLPPGLYRLTQPDQPEGLQNGTTIAGSAGGRVTDVDVTPSVIHDIDLRSLYSSDENNFSEWSGTDSGDRSISGRVFHDKNINDVFDGTDAGLGGQRVVLTGIDEDGNAVSETRTTESDGSYLFDGLPPGVYEVTQPDQPEGLQNGATIPGSAGGQATETTTTPSAIRQIDLTSQFASVENNFAEWTDSTSGNRSISGRVFHDRNINDAYDDNDTGLGGQLVVLSGTDENGNSISDSRITESDGSYVFDGLPPGVYQVTQPDQPEGLLNGTTIPGTAGGEATPVSTTPSSISVIDLTSVARSDGNDFAEWTIPSLSGHVWRDSSHDNIFDPGETGVPGWPVELWHDGVAIAETVTDSTGGYEFSNLTPGEGYEVRFRHPDSGYYFGRPVPNESGEEFALGVISPSNPTGADNTTGLLSEMVIVGGQDIVEQSLPLDPAGVVYDSESRTPVSGATVRIIGPAGFTAEDVLQGTLEQVTGDDGIYQFVLLDSAPSGTYTLELTSPPGYLSGLSDVIPVCDNTLSVRSLTDTVLVQTNNQAPDNQAPLHDPLSCATDASVLTGDAEGTRYYTSFEFSDGVMSLVNNHLPVDPIPDSAIAVTKTTPKVSVTRGELVPYTITATNTLSERITDIDVQDQIPSGFTYVKDSARVNDFAYEPVVEGRLLTWPGQSLSGSEVLTIKLLLVVGSGVGFNDYTNTAWASSLPVSRRLSDVASAVVRVVPDPVFDCTDIIGTVYDDQNRNGYQDSGEGGLPGVRLATPRGWLITTDEHGRYHVACADVPSELRGGNFIIKVDERTLPSGYRIITENPRVLRITQGRMTKANFGASIHRVIRLDLGSDAFNSDNELNSNYQTRMQEVLDLLHAEPSILRIAYRMPVDSPVDQARERIGYIRDWITERWEPDGCCYDLQLEEEIVPATDSVEVIR
ncbi:SdrD B-like domain-containing protein [Marinobacter sp. F3R08]|uniref:DUF7933 domain-containing protein n=1 Tax=Marinobacter sp. F3R08 TaxID=2841559 RepID=UPI001C086D06|nr:SdrD B-like domain-containing protein [Marinobacter sp. F3R08]MBU2954815.1 DUF11 domain-containing protein [Marinobacter sp. F3R08]